MKQESCLAKHGNQREMSDADLTEKNKEREERGGVGGGGAGMERGGTRGAAFGQIAGFCGRLPNL